MFNDKILFNGASKGLAVVERFTRVDDETIRYQFTVEDPTTWLEVARNIDNAPVRNGSK